MRSLLLSLASLAFIPACLIGTGDITGGGDDTKTPGVCGDGTVNTGEACDDGNTVSGDGCSSTCQTEGTSPRVGAMLDKTMIMTELNKTETVMLTLTSLNDFAGTVTITASLLDMATNASIPKVVLTAPASADLVAGGTAMVPVMVNIPSDTTGTAISASLKFDLTSTVAPESVSSPVAIDHIFTVDYIDGTGTATANHAMNNQNYTVLRGTIIRFKNDDKTPAPAPGIQHVIHGDGPFPHQDPRDDPNTQLFGGTYDVPTIAAPPGSAGSLGCHTHGAASYIGFTVM
jgi:cysteine-rich repeat protein